MRANPKFIGKSHEFWSNVKLISEKLGYVTRAKKGDPKGVKVPHVPSPEKIILLYKSRGLDPSKVVTHTNEFTDFGKSLIEYFQYRADALVNYIEPRLMDVAEAKAVFEKLFELHNPQCPIPANKQTGEKKRINYLSAIVNIIVEANIGGLKVNYDPKELTSVTVNNFPVRTLTRRVDGAFPCTVDPYAIWEIKEYYYTTTLGSRVADGIYVTILDNYELKEIEANFNRHIEHYLFIDAKYNWWINGFSFLCRIVDMLHLGVLTEVFFGKEVVERLPEVIKALHEKYKDVAPLAGPLPLKRKQNRRKKAVLYDITPDDKAKVAEPRSLFDEPSESSAAS